MIFKCAGISDSMNDGIGVALDVFFQGCSMKCPGCQNSELQNFEGGFFYDTKNIYKHLKKYKDFYQSVVFLGGEPLEQDPQLVDLILYAEDLDLKTILYTGWLYRNIPEFFRKEIDMIIDGPYIEELKTSGFPASSNQKIYYKGDLVAH